MKKSRLLEAFALCCLLTISTSYAEIVNMNWDGRLTVVDLLGNIVTDSTYAGSFAADDPGAQVPINGTLSYDTLDPISTASMSIASFDFLGNTASLSDVNFLITSDPYTGRLFAIGNLLADWGGNAGIPISTVWDIQGLTNAIFNPSGLQVGDTIINNQLLRGGNVLIADLDSGIPATDGTLVGPSYVVSQGPTPMATTTWNTTDLCVPTLPNDCLGVNPSGGLPLIADSIAGSPMIDGPFSGLSVNIDVGSGGMQVVPIPTAFFLFGSGLLGLIGIARRKKAA